MTKRTGLLGIVVATLLIGFGIAIAAVNYYDYFDTSGLTSMPKPTDDEIHGSVYIEEETGFYSTSLILSGIGVVGEKITVNLTIRNQYIGALSAYVDLTAYPDGMTGENLIAETFANVAQGAKYTKIVSWYPVEGGVDYLMVTTLSNIAWS